MAITVQSQHHCVIPVADLYNLLTATMLGVTSYREGMCGLKSAQAHCSLQIYLFLLLVVRFLYSMLG